MAAKRSLSESLLVLRHLERQINLGIPMSRLALDRGYETGAVDRGWSFWALPDISPQFSSPIHLRNMDSPTIHSSTHSSVRKEFLLLSIVGTRIYLYTDNGRQSNRDYMAGKSFGELSRLSYIDLRQHPQLKAILPGLFADRSCRLLRALWLGVPVYGSGRRGSRDVENVCT